MRTAVVVVISVLFGAALLAGSFVFRVFSNLQIGLGGSGNPIIHVSSGSPFVLEIQSSGEAKSTRSAGWDCNGGKTECWTSAPPSFKMSSSYTPTGGKPYSPGSLQAGSLFWHLDFVPHGVRLKPVWLFGSTLHAYAPQGDVWDLDDSKSKVTLQKTEAQNKPVTNIILTDTLDGTQLSLSLCPGADSGCGAIVDIGK